MRGIGTDGLLNRALPRDKEERKSSCLQKFIQTKAVGSNNATSVSRSHVVWVK